MNFFRYLLANRLLLFVGFLALVAGFVFVSSYFGPLEGAAKWVSIFCGVLTVIFIGGNWHKWRQL